MTKGELMGIVFSDAERNSIDVSLPQNWFDKAEKLNIDTFAYVWSYIDKKIFGEPVNMYEKYMEKQGIDTNKVLVTLSEQEASNYDKNLPRLFMESAMDLGLKTSSYVVEKNTGKIINLIQRYGEKILHPEEDYT
jgi:hypothetical protein